MKEYINQLENCLQHEKAFCTGACPFELDVNTFIARLQEGRFNAAYKTYRDATGFPFIAARLCSQPCQKACLAHAVKDGDPIDLLRLESACLSYAKRKDPNKYNLPKKNKSVAIIGGGISGMACALRMATKKYRVTVFERTDQLGGCALQLMDPQIVQDDFGLQMQHLDINYRFLTEVHSIEEVLQYGYEESRNAAKEAKPSAIASVMRSHTTNATASANSTYDAIYIATGAGGEDFGILNETDGKSLCTVVEKTAVFLGGSLVGKDPVYALADGLNMSTAIDNYTMTKVLKYPEPAETRITIDETAMVNTRAEIPSAGEGYTEEEAVQEAKRCMMCQCSACRIHCDLTDYLHKWPLRLKDEVLATTAPGRSELHATPAVRTINMCTHCGLCEETCPESIDMDGLFQAARVRMHKLEKMPWAFNDYFLRDMDFSNGNAAYYCKSPTEKSTYALYPGCQLGGSAPELVLNALAYLQAHEPSSGIMLGCCGVPARWAGNEELHQQVLSRIHTDWQNLGEPTMVLTCPTCRKTFAQYLPDIPTVFLYDLMDRWGIDPPGHSLCGGTDAYSVFDPCATAPEDDVRASVRGLCQKLGLQLEPLPVQEKWTACCSYGGHGALADPEFTKFVRDKRISESELPFITYCINCRDSFLHEGKDAVHILDLVFGARTDLPTITDRRKNRIRLKETLMKQFGEEPTADFESDHSGIVLKIDPELARKISEDYILESEVANVIAFCEENGRTVYNTEKDSYTGYRKIGYMTYWVEYRKTEEPNTFVLLNAYSHRMEIELEMIWNGEKVDIDL